MTKQETAKILAVLQAAYPNFYRGMSASEVDSVIAVWASMFEHEPYTIVSAAIKTLLASDEKGYPPHIGAVKAAIRCITEPDTPTESEAWAVVMKAASNSAYHSESEFLKLPETIKSTVGSARALRTIGLAEGDELTVLQSNFMRSYRAVVSREKTRSIASESNARLFGGTTVKEIGGG